MVFWVVQGLGIIALLFYVLSFQMKTKENLLIAQVTSNSFSAVQYLLVWALTGAVQTILGILRGIVFYLYKKRNLNPNRTVIIIFGAAIIIETVFTWNGIILSILPLLGMMANLYGQWQDNMKRLRILAIVSSLMWTVYIIQTGVYTAVLTEILKIVSSAMALWRYRKNNMER